LGFIKLSKLCVLVTGASGFVGGALIQALSDNDYHVIAALRSKAVTYPDEIELLRYSDILAHDWSSQLSSVDTIIHAAARVHIMDDSSTDPLAAFREINVTGTLNLAKQAAVAGVKRFIFISSIKVNGETTSPNHPFTAEDENIPIDPYGLSKYEAEQGLLKLAKQTEMEVVIIRPPLVYGTGVKANFAAMINLIRKGLPMPFGAINNQRSFVALDNLVNFIIHCIDHPKAANEIFLISDGGYVSTTELIKKVAKAFDKKAWLLPIPVSWMTFVAKLVGKTDVTERLFGSLQVDSSKARDLLGWKPVVTMDEQLKIIAENYQSNEKNF
jgi:nucleoside-diphosphate-sugar epimerase